MISFHKHFEVTLTSQTSTSNKPPFPWAWAASLTARVIFSALMGIFIAQGAAAQLIDKRVTALNPLDRQYMDLQRQSLNDLTLRYYGGRCCRSQSELDYLQRLLDDGHIRADQTKELQAMGVALGDLLARELDMHWVVYEDIQGRSRALRLGETDNYLFPVTMIARRHEGGDKTPVQEVYRQAYEAIETVRPPLPFQ